MDPSKQTTSRIQTDHSDQELPFFPINESSFRMELVRRYGKIFFRPALLETEIRHEPPLERLHYAFDQAN